MAMVVAGASAYAQIGQGTLMLGGSLGFNSTGEQTTKITNPNAPDVKTPGYSNWNFSPRIGYFLTDDIALGIDLGLGQTYRGNTTSTNGDKTDTYSSFDFSVGVFGRYYMNLSDNLYFYGQARVGFTTSSYTELDPAPSDPGALQDGDKVTNNQFGIGITPGLTFFPAPKWGVDFNLGGIINFASNTTKVETPVGPPPANATISDRETTRSDFGIGFGLNPTLGLHYYMGR